MVYYGAAGGAEGSFVEYDEYPDMKKAIARAPATRGSNSGVICGLIQGFVTHTGRRPCDDIDLDLLHHGAALTIVTQRARWHQLDDVQLERMQDEVVEEILARMEYLNPTSIDLHQPTSFTMAWDVMYSEVPSVSGILVVRKRCIGAKRSGCMLKYERVLDSPVVKLTTSAYNAVKQREERFPNERVPLQTLVQMAFDKHASSEICPHCGGIVGETLCSGGRMRMECFFGGEGFKRVGNVGDFEDVRSFLYIGSTAITVEPVNGQNTKAKKKTYQCDVAGMLMFEPGYHTLLWKGGSGWGYYDGYADPKMRSVKVDKVMGWMQGISSIMLRQKKGLVRGNPTIE